MHPVSQICIECEFGWPVFLEYYCGVVAPHMFDWHALSCNTSSSVHMHHISDIHLCKLGIGVVYASFRIFLHSWLFAAVFRALMHTHYSFAATFDFQLMINSINRSLSSIYVKSHFTPSVLAVVRNWSIVSSVVCLYRMKCGRLILKLLFTFN